MNTVSDNRPKRLAMVNGKGGVGKTMCSLLFAAALQDNGCDVVIDDRDPQKSATVMAENMGLRIGTHASYIIIDTPPDVEKPGFLDAIKEADIVVLITSPSPSDLSSTASTAVVIARLRTKKTAILINKFKPNTVLGREVDGVANVLPFEKLKNYLGDRQSYQKAQLNGWKSLPKSDANEVLRVVLEIIT